MDKNALQLGFSEQHAGAVYNPAGRAQKAKKTLSILEDFSGDTAGLSLLDIGCAAGYTTILYAERFKSVVGIDVDKPAVEHAKKHNASLNLEYHVVTSQDIDFPDNFFDVIICSHVYEHVPDAEKLMSEIYRLLKKGGVCYFAAGNRFSLIEPHYRLPFLSVIPKWSAHYYLRLLKRGRYYYENHLSYWGLRRLVSRFDVLDYTIKVVQNPARFHAADMLVPGSLKQKAALVFLKMAYWMCPTYLWLLIKK